MTVRVWGTEIEVGRGSAWFGPGEWGDFVLTDHAPPFDRVRVSRWVGPFHGTVLLGRMRNRDPRTPDGPERDEAFLGMRLVWTYFDRLIAEVSFGSIGENLEQVTRGQVQDIHRTAGGVNQVAELGLSYYLRDGIKVYAVTGGDEIWGVGWARRIIPWGRRSGYLCGLYVSDMLGDGRWDGRVEWARLMEEGAADWYHHENPYVHRGTLIGHPMAYVVGSSPRSNEREISCRVTYRLGDRWELGGRYEVQRASVRPQGHQDMDHVGVHVRGSVGQTIGVRVEGMFFIEEVKGDSGFGREQRGGRCTLSVTYGL